MAKELAKSYKPSDFEDKIYDFWIKGNYFRYAAAEHHRSAAYRPRA